MKLETIVAPCDLEEASAPGLRAAAELVRMSGGTLVVVHVMTSRSIDTSEVPHTVSPIREQVEHEARARLEALVSSVAGDIETDLHVVFGDPAREIIRTAAAVSADAIVITVKNRSRVGKLLMGSHAQEIILGAGRPVVTIPREARA